ncbi:MAG: ADP-ribosylglycohydrolase family protein [Algiphilus sp.]
MSAVDEDRATGCLVGLACGDAVGAPVEFFPRGRFRPLTGMRGGGKFQVQPGQWTDDTSMALCLSDSLIAVDGFDPLDQMERYYRWAETGYNSSKAEAFGLGKTVLRAFVQFRTTGDAYCGPVAEKFSGNGSLMRLAPIPIFFHRNVEEVRHFAALSSKVTHASETCLAACAAFSEILHNALLGMPREALFGASGGRIEAFLAAYGIGDFRTKTADQVKGSGFVIECLEAALWAFWNTERFEQAILAAANLGDDADTTAAVCGQLAGAYYGMGGIPQTWRTRLHEASRIERCARALLRGPSPSSMDR